MADTQDDVNYAPSDEEYRQKRAAAEKRHNARTALLARPADSDDAGLNVAVSEGDSVGFMAISPDKAARLSEELAELSDRDSD
ncbi:hypothetical protein NX059_012227 [Plenodomus lindquistii]|nr:hypothetical protein NX059_012227 [Plenodomus lindquistii]